MESWSPIIISLWGSGCGFRSPKALATKSTRANMRSWVAGCVKGFSINVRVFPGPNWFIISLEIIPMDEMDDFGVPPMTSETSKFHGFFPWSWSWSRRNMEVMTTSPLLQGNFGRSQGRRFFMKVCLAKSTTSVKNGSEENKGKHLESRNIPNMFIQLCIYMSHCGWCKRMWGIECCAKYCPVIPPQ